MQAFYCITKQIKQENKDPVNKRKLSEMILEQ